jgi:hypothetical protein
MGISTNYSYAAPVSAPPPPAKTDTAQRLAQSPDAAPQPAADSHGPAVVLGGALAAAAPQAAAPAAEAYSYGPGYYA